jgi:hypothetical protein
VTVFHAMWMLDLLLEDTEANENQPNSKNMG